MNTQKKGRHGEIELSRILNDNGIPARPGNALNFGTMPDVTGIDGIHAEVKRVEKLNVQEAMGQAIRDAEKFGDGTPALFHRRNRTPWLVTMRLDDWLKLYKGET
jgi:Holliday junction resolvase